MSRAVKKYFLILLHLLLISLIFHFILNFRSTELIFHQNYKKSDEKISYEEEKLIEYEKKRRGNGEQGEAFYLTDAEDLTINDEWITKEGFSVIVSDRISVDRSLPDYRPEACKSKKYLKNLPRASVIITFHNEIYSVLLRCIHSIFNRSPSQLLHELILINDASTYENLGEQLEKYIANETVFEGKIKLHKNAKREGLIRARMIGARLAEAEVIIFLDSHMEVTTTWLPPLLDPIALNPKIASVPHVEMLDHATFAYKPTQGCFSGIFDWSFRYQWIPLHEPNLGENFDLPCMTGGAYAIRRRHFFYLGGYDEGLMIWNGENYELSLKLWLCSGGIVKVPCSRIIHLTKLHTAHRSSANGAYYSARNLKRVAEVWLDDYKKYFYRTNPARYDKIDPGDLTRQLEFKKRMNCKPFQYYLDNVATEMLVRYPLEPQYFATSSIQLQSIKKCLMLQRYEATASLILVKCSDDLTKPARNSGFSLTVESSLRFNDNNDQCLDSANLSFVNCHHLKGNQEWLYNRTTMQIYQPHRRKCLSGNEANEVMIFLGDCDDRAMNQKWKWGVENSTALS